MNQNNNDDEKFKPSLFGEDYIEESFSMDYADTYEKEMHFADNNLNETILEKKMKKLKNSVQNPNETFSLFNQIENINAIDDDDLNITIHDKQKDDYLEVRKIPKYSENEFLNIKNIVSGGYPPIKNYLLNLRCDLTGHDLHKKVGPLSPLTFAIEENYAFKPELRNEMQKKYDRLKKYICNYRTIYGDGNCYYRAIVFRYIELLILYKKVDILKSLIVDIYKSFQSEEVKRRLWIGKDYLNPNLIVQIFLVILEQLENNRIGEAHLSFYKALLFSKLFDFSLILYLRYIIYIYIKQNEKKLYLESFPVLIGNLLPSNYEKDGVFDFNSFYENFLLKMFQFAEKIVIYLTPFVLGINLNVILFEDNENEVIKKFGFSGKSNLFIDDIIFILNRSGHYENIFSYEDNQKYNFIYYIYQNNLRPFFINVDNSLVINNFNNNNSNKNYNNNFQILSPAINYNQYNNQNNNNVYNNQFNQNTNNINNRNNYYKTVVNSNKNDLRDEIFPEQNKNNYQNQTNYSENNNNTVYNRNTNCYQGYFASNNINQNQMNNQTQNNNYNENDYYNRTNSFTHNTSNNNIINFQNNNNNSDNKEQGYSNGTNIYFYNNQNNFLQNQIFFEESNKNIYILAQKINNFNLNNFKNNNMNNDNYMINNINYNNNNYMNNNINNNNNCMNNNNNYMNNNTNNINNNNNYMNNNNINNNYMNNNMNSNSNNMNSNMNNNNNNYMNSNNFNYMNNNMNNNLNNNNNYMNNNMINSKNNLSFNINELTKGLIGKGPYKCNKCSLTHQGLNRIINICPNCFILEIIRQSKILYVGYLKNVNKLEKANTITKNDFKNLFLDKISINFDEKKYTIYQAIYEFNSNQNNISFDFEKIKNEIISELKLQICLYCYCDVQNTNLILPCGCNFCSYNHLNSFFKEKIQNKLCYNFKCFCSYEYKPNKILELFNILKKINIFKDYNNFLQNLNKIFRPICFKCGKEKSNLSLVDFEGFIPIQFNHFICDDCIQNSSSNNVVCSICKIQHKYILKDF